MNSNIYACIIRCISLLNSMFNSLLLWFIIAFEYLVYLGSMVLSTKCTVSHCQTNATKYNKWQKYADIQHQVITRTNDDIDHLFSNSQFHQWIVWYIPNISWICITKEVWGVCICVCVHLWSAGPVDINNMNLVIPVPADALTPNALQWCHNERYGIPDHQPHECLLNLLFRRRSKKTSKLGVTGLCAGNSPVTGEFPRTKGQ